MKTTKPQDESNYSGNEIKIGIKMRSQQKLALQNGREIEKQIIFFDQPKNKRD